MISSHLSYLVLCTVLISLTVPAMSTTAVQRAVFSIRSSDPDVVLEGEWWSSPQAAVSSSQRPLFLFIHQYTVMGGSRSLMAGMASRAAASGYEAVTFDLRGAGGSSGSCTFRNKSERNDVVAMIKHVESSSSRPIFLVGSSAGAALAGSVLDISPRVLGGLFVGYTWGWGASLLFGWAFASIQASSKPKLFVVGTADEFTSMRQYETRLGALAGANNDMVVIEGKNHFQIESAEYDEFVVEKAIAMIEKFSAMQVEAESKSEECSSTQRE